MPLESAATLPEGDTGIQVQGGMHAAVFGPSALSGTVRVRHGVAKDVDLDVEASALRIQTNADPAVPTSRTSDSLALGAKVRVADALAISGALGGGYSAGGAFVSPEAGPILAFENRYFVPFLATRFGVSQPISPRDVDTSEAGQPPGTYVDRPHATWIATAVLGFRIPIGWTEPEAGTTRGSILAGAGVTHLADSRDKETFGQLALGGEIVF